MQKTHWSRRTAVLLLLTAALAAGVTATIILNNHRSDPAAIPGTREPGTPPLLTEFGDFQCPYCARFALEVLPALKRDLIDQGAIRFEYRHYPFLGPESFAAAEASECAREQGEFHAYHLRLYRTTLEREKLIHQALREAAEATGLDLPAFDQCLSSERNRPRVLEDREYGRALGVRGTPTLLLDGSVVRWKNYSDLRKQLEAEAPQEAVGAPPAAEQRAPRRDGHAGTEGGRQ